tara:strand:- start:510 stop:746 length:237 start_codon:yes stop_codon:yes gene_type:complete
MNGLILFLAMQQHATLKRKNAMVDGNAGKGDNYRKVDQKKWDEGWESAFGKKKEKKMKFNNKVIDMTKFDKKKENDDE